MSPPEPVQQPEEPSVIKIFLSFLRLGLTAFGGPAMVAYIKKMAVDREHWIDEESFRGGVSFCQMVPGATAMQTGKRFGYFKTPYLGYLINILIIHFLMGHNSL